MSGKRNASPRSILIDGGKISYTLVKKRIKNLNMRVRPDGSVHVSVPHWVSVKQADDFVKSRLSFILRARETYEKREDVLKACPSYREGDVFFYFGEKKTIHVRACERGEKEGVQIMEDRLVLSVCRPHEQADRTKVMETWIRKIALYYFDALCTKVFPRFAPFSVSKPEVRVRKMKAVWGNCRPKAGIVTFNTRLVHTPHNCCLYVCVHELCHLVHPNHSASFYKLVASILPDYQKRKEELSRFG